VLLGLTFYWVFLMDFLGLPYWVGLADVFNFFSLRAFGTRPNFYALTHLLSQLGPIFLSELLGSDLQKWVLKRV